MAHKVAVNTCYGGFALSEKAVRRYEELSGRVITWQLPCRSWEPDSPLKTFWDDDDIPRHDPALIQVIEELGEDANKNDCTSIAIEEIPGNRYRIEEYDGIETIHCPEDENCWIVIED